MDFNLLSSGSEVLRVTAYEPSCAARRREAGHGSFKSKTALGSGSQEHKKRPCAGRHIQNPEVLAVHCRAPQPVALARQGGLRLQTRTGCRHMLGGYTLCRAPCCSSLRCLAQMLTPRYLCPCCSSPTCCAPPHHLAEVPRHSCRTWTRQHCPWLQVSDPQPHVSECPMMRI